MNPRESLWNLRFHQLAEYKQAHGYCAVSQNSGHSLELGRWVARQRLARHRNRLNAEREAKLDSIGFSWNLRGCNSVNWDVRFRQLLEYKQAAGDCNVPHAFSRNPQLGRWVHSQRLCWQPRARH
jgi:hypothetical protein